MLLSSSTNVSIAEVTTRMVIIPIAQRRKHNEVHCPERSPDNRLPHDQKDNRHHKCIWVRHSVKEAEQEKQGDKQHQYRKNDT